MAYKFTWAEFGWMFLVAVLPPILLDLTNFDPGAISDYRAWGLSVAAASIRALAGAALAFVVGRQRRIADPEETL